jgi:F420-non-reducing hydrogenase small subunit
MGRKSMSTDEAMPGAKEKLKIGMYWAAGCGGCDISLLEIGPRLLELIEAADIVFWPCATDFKYRDVVNYPDRFMDICFFNGGVRSSEQEELARLIRSKCKTLVAYGACACDGGIPSLANTKTVEGIFDASYHDNPSLDNPDHVEPQPMTTCEFGELEIPRLYPQVLRLSDVVEVDYRIPGCPPVPDRVWEAILALIGGGAPTRNSAVKVACTDKSVCDDCSLEKRQVRIKEFKRPHEAIPEAEWCLLEQGFICMGPATRSGCGALCTRAHLSCRGCYGPCSGVEDQGAAMIGALGSILDADTEERAREMIDRIVDPVGTFYRFTMASSDLKGSK